MKTEMKCRWERHRGVETREKNKAKGRKRSSATGVGVKKEERRQGTWLPAAALSFISPCLTLGHQVRMQNMPLLGWGPTGCWLALSYLWELSLTRTWETQQPRGQETFPRRSKGSGPSSAWRVEGLCPPLMITAFSLYGSCAPVPVLVGSLPEGSYLCRASQGPPEGPGRKM